MKATMRYHYTPIKKLKWKRLVELPELSCTFCKNVKWDSRFGKVCRFLVELNIYLLYDLVISLIIIHNYPKLETIQLSSAGEYIVIGPYNGILPSNEKEWTTNTYNDVDAPQKYYAKGKKLKGKPNGDRKQISGCQGLRWGWERTPKGHRRTLCGAQKCCSSWLWWW